MSDMLAQRDVQRSGKCPGSDRLARRQTILERLYLHFVISGLRIALETGLDALREIASSNIKVTRGYYKAFSSSVITSSGMPTSSSAVFSERFQRTLYQGLLEVCCARRTASSWKRARETRDNFAAALLRTLDFRQMARNIHEERARR